MTIHNWQDRGAIRERLALLAAIGPNVDPQEWDYDSHWDRWIHCRFAENQRTVAVRQEAAESLAICERRWGLSRSLAMTFIGYPEAL